MQPSFCQVLPPSAPSFPARALRAPGRRSKALPQPTAVLSSSHRAGSQERTYLVGGLSSPFPPLSRRRGPDGVTERLGCPQKASGKTRHRTSPTGTQRHSWRQSRRSAGTQWLDYVFLLRQVTRDIPSLRAPAIAQGSALRVHSWQSCPQTGRTSVQGEL